MQFPSLKRKQEFEIKLSIFQKLLNVAQFGKNTLSSRNTLFVTSIYCPNTNFVNHILKIKIHKTQDG